MLFSSSQRFTVFLFIGTLIVACPAAQERAVLPGNGANCWSDTFPLIYNELSLSLNPNTDFSERRVYTICQNTTLVIGVQPNTETPFYFGGAFPFIIFNPNITLQCGETGVSSNSCKLSGGETNLVTMENNDRLNQFITAATAGLIPGVTLPAGTALPPDFVADSSGLIVKGLTFENNFSGEIEESTFSIQGRAKNVVIEDCRFRNNDPGKPQSMAIQILYSGEITFAGPFSLQDEGGHVVSVSVQNCTFEVSSTETPMRNKTLTLFL